MYNWEEMCAQGCFALPCTVMSGCLPADHSVLTFTILHVYVLGITNVLKMLGLCGAVGGGTG